MDDRVLKMFKFCVFLAFCVTVSYGAPGGGGTYCGETPTGIYQCLNSPKVISAEVSAKCTKYENECDKLTCVFRESKWLDGTAVDKTKVSAHLAQFETDHTEWGPAVQYAKTACLGPELKAQGVFLNCPAYDVTHCVLSSFIKHATPTQWSTSASCSYPRAYAAACPVCPSDCFSPQVPYGSCNACYLPPKTV